MMIPIGTSVLFQDATFPEDRVWNKGVVTGHGRCIDNTGKMRQGYHVECGRTLFFVYSGMRAIKAKK